MFFRAAADKKIARLFQKKRQDQNNLAVPLFLPLSRPLNVNKYTPAVTVRLRLSLLGASSVQHSCSEVSYKHRLP